jgi:succinate dehydrogenase/fumarate reductase-like Fe-S protein
MDKYKVHIKDLVIERESKTHKVEAANPLDARKKAVDEHTINYFTPAQRLALYKQPTIPMLTHYLKCIGLKVERCRKQ